MASPYGLCRSPQRWFEKAAAAGDAQLAMNKCRHPLFAGRDGNGVPWGLCRSPQRWYPEGAAAGNTGVSGCARHGALPTCSSVPEGLYRSPQVGTRRPQPQVITPAMVNLGNLYFSRQWRPQGLYSRNSQSGTRRPQPQQRALNGLGFIYEKRQWRPRGSAEALKWYEGPQQEATHSPWARLGTLHY